MNGAASALALARRFFEALTTPRRWRDTDVTPFEKTRVLDPSPDRATIDAVFDLVRKTYAPFRSATPVQRWAGYIDVLPDVIPVISPTQGVKNGLPGLFVATGFSGHGFGLGPGAGLLAADLITGSAPCVDPAPFRLHRFSDGSPITPMSGIIQR